MLHCIVLYCIVLYCIVLYCIALCCNVTSLYSVCTVLGVIVITPTGAVSGLFRMALLHKVPPKVNGVSLGQYGCTRTYV